MFSSTPREFELPFLKLQGLIAPVADFGQKLDDFLFGHAIYPGSASRASSVPATTTTQTSVSGRNTFQPSRIN